MTIANVTQFDNSDDLGGLTIYYKSDKLVAFYDYEQQRGTIFTEPVWVKITWYVSTGATILQLSMSADKATKQMRFSTLKKNTNG